MLCTILIFVTRKVVLTVFVTFYLKSIRIDFKLFDMGNRGHVLLIVLLVLLLLTKLSKLEHLQPTFITEYIGAELNHFTINGVIGGNISDQLGVARLNIGNHLHMDLNAITYLFIVEPTILYRRLIVEAKFIPDAPRLFLSFLDEIVNIIVGSIAKLGQKFELSLTLSICLDFQTLSTIYNVLCHSNFHSIFD